MAQFWNSRPNLGCWKTIGFENLARKLNVRFDRSSRYKVFMAIYRLIFAVRLYVKLVNVLIL